MITPDLPGHGGSRSRNGDHTLGATATALRDLVAVLGENRVTVLGHSLGGGVALHFAYQYPQLCSKVVLVSPGGLGREIHPALRAMSLPGSELVLAALGWFSGLRSLARRQAGKAPSGPGHGFLRVLRTVVDWRGQRVDALDALAVISAAVPTVLVWGEEDPLLPLAHAVAAHAAAPALSVLTIPGAGHAPHLDDPEGFYRLVGPALSAEAQSASKRSLGEVLAERCRAVLPEPAVREALAADPAAA